MARLSLPPSLARPSPVLLWRRRDMETLSSGKSADWLTGLFARRPVSCELSPRCCYGGGRSQLGSSVCLPLLRTPCLRNARSTHALVDSAPPHNPPTPVHVCEGGRERESAGEESLLNISWKLCEAEAEKSLGRTGDQSDCTGSRF